MAGVDGCVRIINEVDPHAIAVDNILNQGYDACIKLGRKHFATGPFALKDICIHEQSRFVLNYPACFSFSPPYSDSDSDTQDMFWIPLPPPLAQSSPKHRTHNIFNIQPRRISTLRSDQHRPKNRWPRRSPPSLPGFQKRYRIPRRHDPRTRLSPPQPSFKYYDVWAIRPPRIFHRRRD